MRKGQNGKKFGKTELAKELPRFIHTELVDSGEKLPLHDNFLKGSTTALASPQSRPKTQMCLFGDFVQSQGTFLCFATWCGSSRFFHQSTSLLLWLLSERRETNGEYSLQRFLFAAWTGFEDCEVSYLGDIPSYLYLRNGRYSRTRCSHIAFFYWVWRQRYNSTHVPAFLEWHYSLWSLCLPQWASYHWPDRVIGIPLPPTILGLYKSWYCSQFWKSNGPRADHRLLQVVACKLEVPTLTALFREVITRWKFILRYLTTHSPHQEMRVHNKARFLPIVDWFLSCICVIGQLACRLACVPIPFAKLFLSCL